MPPGLALTAPAVPPPDSSSPPAPNPQEESVRWFIAEVQPHQSTLRRWLGKRFPWLADVDNTAQEAVTRLWLRKRKEAAGHKPIQAPKAALYMIARNAAYDEARRNQVAKFEPVTEAGDLSVLAGEDVVATVAARQELEFFSAALAELPDRCRQVITLTKVYGLTELEAAERLGIAASSVRTQVIRGMERIDAYMRRHGARRGPR